MKGNRKQVRERNEGGVINSLRNIVLLQKTALLSPSFSYNIDAYAPRL